MQIWHNFLHILRNIHTMDSISFLLILKNECDCDEHVNDAQYDIIWHNENFVNTKHSRWNEIEVWIKWIVQHSSISTAYAQTGTQNPNVTHLLINRVHKAIRWEQIITSALKNVFFLSVISAHIKDNWIILNVKVAQCAYCTDIQMSLNPSTVLIWSL